MGTSRGSWVSLSNGRGYKSWVVGVGVCLMVVGRGSWVQVVGRGCGCG